MKIIDITQELFSCNVYPGDTPPAFERIKTIEHDKYNLTNISMCVHNGTHIDAPNHFIENGKAIHDLDLSVFYGACTVAEFSGIIGKNETAAVLEKCKERLLIKGQCELSDSAAALIANSHIRLVGVESQSIGSAEYPLRIHVVLLEKEIIPLEGLDLSDVSPGEYILSAFPLCLHGSDGSPVRAVLIDESAIAEQNEEEAISTETPRILEDNLPDVTFHIQSSFDYGTHLGGYRMLMQFGDRKKYFAEHNLSGNSNVTMIILAVIHAVEQLKKPCNIKVYSDTLFGITNIIKHGRLRQHVSENASNYEQKETLRRLLESGGHKMENFADGSVKSVLLEHERIRD